MSNERIAIVGAGAVGAYAGGFMHAAGENVTFFDPWPENVVAMRERGLRLLSAEGEVEYEGKVRAHHLSDIAAMAPMPEFDIAFVCAKSYDTAWHAQLIKPYLAADGFVVSLQNCINEDTIAEVVGWTRTMGCIASLIAVFMDAPGQVRRMVPRGGAANHVVFRAGEPHGRITKRAERIAELVGHTDGSKTTNNLWGERWSKLITNSMRNPVIAASGLTNVSSDLEPVTRRLSIRIAAEGVRVATANGIELEAIRGIPADTWIACANGDDNAFGTIEARVIQAAENAKTDGRPSMAQDVEKGRRSEIDFMNGLIVRTGKMLGLETPANEGIVTAMRSVDARTAAPSVDVVRDI
ncbi:MAG: 2-dehydropantoate 2-reductase [Gammaproteobacteria bacterium]|nr:2-dehydropantoate 2-reductase [Gammaproteobacteria bacterium]|tara:strand:- start:3606 stop:4664 length:1059 start_codon:yes stop_codon:yes gene_type:complete